MAFEMMAVVCAGLFAGAANYVTFVEHPARMECGTAIAAAQFGPSYRRAAIVQASLAMLGFAAALFAWRPDRGLALLIGGIVLGSVVPYSLLVVFPVNRRLLDPTLDRNSAEAATLLVRWGRRHAGRSLLGGAAFILLVLAGAR
jgi:hypothetical protein